MNKMTLKSRACEYSVPIWGYSLEKIKKCGLAEGSHWEWGFGSI